MEGLARTRERGAMMTSCDACAHASDEWPTLCADGEVCWPGDCPACGHEQPPTRYGEPLTVERALELERLAQHAGAVHLG